MFHLEKFSILMFYSTFLNICKIDIIDVLMLLCIIFNICFMSPFLLTDFSPHVGSYFPASLPGSFLWYARHCEFYLVGCWIVCIALSILDLCSEI